MPCFGGETHISHALKFKKMVEVIWQEAAGPCTSELQDLKLCAGETCSETLGEGQLRTEPRLKGAQP